jgi:hypothetical protein
MIARIISQKLQQTYRCLYLNSPQMLTGMRRYLVEAGVDVEYETLRMSLILSAEKNHLVDGRRFSVDRMMHDLEDALEQALDDGYAGLWATGDMTWELGPEVGSGKLLEYEWRLEEFFRSHPEIGGVCQYHIDSLPGVLVREGLCSHPGLFVNETLSMSNPHYVSPEMMGSSTLRDEDVTKFVDFLTACR